MIPASAPPRSETGWTDEDIAELWKADQGEAWAERNPRTVEALDQLYFARFGFTRSYMMADWFNQIPKDAKILEVGASAGTQLRVLEQLGFTNLHATDINEAALAENPYPKKCADAVSLPYETGEFDLVFTSGTLMHIPPSVRHRAMREIARVSKTWIFGTEYWYAQATMMRFEKDFIPPIWVEDFGAVYLGVVPDLAMQRFQLYYPLDPGAAFALFLLRKR